MKAIALALILPFALFAQDDGNLDVITLDGHPCPMEGDAKVADVKQLNRDKNRYHPPATSEINPAITLTAMVAPGDDEHRFDNRSAATITGYVLRAYEGSVETCNCKDREPSGRDTHVILTLSPGADRTQGIVAEVTPRIRIVHQRNGGGTDWTTEALARDIQGKWVQVTGWMLFDLEHVDESENTNPGGTENVRATAWEIHPITAIKVLDNPPPESFQLDPAVVKAFQKAQAAHVNEVPRRKQFIAERIERYRRMMGDERDDDSEK